LKVLLRAQATLHQGNQMLASARPAWQAAEVQGPPAADVQGPPAPRALQPPYLAAAPQYLYAPAPRLVALAPTYAAYQQPESAAEQRSRSLTLTQASAQASAQAYAQAYAQPAAAGAPHPPQQQQQQAMSAEQLSADIDCAKAGVFCTGGAQQSRRHGAGFNSWMASNPVFGHGKSGESGNSGGDI